MNDLQAWLSERIKPWVEERMQHYVGEQAPQMCTFICEKLNAHCAPQELCDDMTKVRLKCKHALFYVCTSLYRLNVVLWRFRAKEETLYLIGVDFSSKMKRITHVEQREAW